MRFAIIDTTTQRLCSTLFTTEAAAQAAWFKSWGPKKYGDRYAILAIRTVNP